MTRVRRAGERLLPMCDDRDHLKDHAGERATVPSCRLLNSLMPWVVLKVARALVPSLCGTHGPLLLSAAHLLGLKESGAGEWAIQGAARTEVPAPPRPHAGLDAALGGHQPPTFALLVHDLPGRVHRPAPLREAVRTALGFELQVPQLSARKVRRRGPLLPFREVTPRRAVSRCERRRTMRVIAGCCFCWCCSFDC